ncbi:MAG TPA: hypothetical protein VF453_03950, partial [Burkholderiaceae bacterium]
FVTRERVAAGPGEEGDTAWRIALIQKDPRRGARGRVSLAGLPGAALAKVASARLETWRCADVFDSSDERALWQHADEALAPASTFDLRLPPASLALLTINLKAFPHAG